jgi:serine/threonine protein kinase
MVKKIGKYELGITLGTGQFSKVKVGIDTETNKQWAIKIIDKAQLQRQRMEEQLKREIAIMKTLQHDNVVQLHEVMQTGNNIYLVLEVVSGGELFDKIKSSRKLDEATARRYFQNLITGVHYCHSQGIAHRDIKVENLLLDSNDVLKIADFGLSNLQPANNGAVLRTVCGTPHYVSPEVLKEQPYNGFIADAWSCGIVLFVMLAGYLPFDDENMNSLFNKIERGEFRLSRQFTEGASKVISALLTVDPAQRMTIDDVIKNEWFQVGFDPAVLTKGYAAEPTAEQVDQALKDEVDCDDEPTTNGLDTKTVATLLATTDHANVCYVLFGGGQDEVIGTFKAINCNSKLVGGEIKGFVNGSNGLVTFTTTVQVTATEGNSLAEVRRGRGDTGEFTTISSSFAQALSETHPPK